jgi:hypothetical protein
MSFLVVWPAVARKVDSIAPAQSYMVLAGIAALTCMAAGSGFYHYTTYRSKFATSHAVGQNVRPQLVSAFEFIDTRQLCRKLDRLVQGEQVDFKLRQVANSAVWSLGFALEQVGDARTTEEAERVLDRAAVQLDQLSNLLGVLDQKTNRAVGSVFETVRPNFDALFRRIRTHSAVQAKIDDLRIKLDALAKHGKDRNGPLN